MQIETSLKQLGLNNKEAKVYLACLNLGQTTALNIAKATLLKRPTIYTVLETLRQKGLVYSIPKVATTEFIAQDPQRLLHDLEQRTKMMRNLLPTLRAIQPQGEGRPKITIYEGKQEMEKVYLSIFKAKEIYFYATDMEILSKNFFLILEQGHKIFHEKKTRTKEIMNGSPVDVAYALAQRSALRKIRITPPGVHFMEDNAIWENNIWIASIREPFFGVKIESQSIANTYRAFFEMAWATAIEPEMF